MPELSSFFEALMLGCFGASWPFAVLKVYRSKNVNGISLPFLWLILAGYGAGIIFKIIGNPDWVITLYLFNFILVAINLFLYYRYRETTTVVLK